jgi:hypothetical protein
MTATLSPDTAPTTPTRGTLAVKILLVVLCLCVAAMWVYYFFGASDQGVYQLQDKSWRLKADVVCTAAQKERQGLADTSGGYIAHPTKEQMAQRADIVDKATDILDTMLHDIVAIPVASDRDRLLLSSFDEKYKMIIADRRRYAASLRAGKLVPYTETLLGGGPITNVVEDFTAGVKGNNIPSCSPPNELGGDIKP